jgi:hypothetical protein
LDRIRDAAKAQARASPQNNSWDTPPQSKPELPQKTKSRDQARCVSRHSARQTEANLAAENSGTKKKDFKGFYQGS